MTDTARDSAAPGLWNIGEPNPRRSLILCAIGAIAGLLIAGVGLFTAQGTRTFVIPAEDAAVVNGVPVLMSDYVAQITTLYDVPYAQATGAQKRKVLDDMIREELYVQRGVELGLPTDDIDVRTALVAGTEAVVSQDALTELPADRALRAWYAAHRDTYSSEGTMTLQEFVLPASVEPGATRLVGALRGGAAPASLGLKSSGRVDDGEEYYFAAKAHLGDRLFALARQMADGQVSDPVVLPDGIHVLVMQRNQPPLPTAYDLSRDRVLHDFLDDKVKHLQAGNQTFLRRRADIKIAPALR